MEVLVALEPELVLEPVAADTHLRLAPVAGLGSRRAEIVDSNRALQWKIIQRTLGRFFVRVAQLENHQLVRPVTDRRQTDRRHI